MPYLLKKQLKLLKYKNKIVKLIMVFSNCESKMGDFEPDVDIDEKQAGFKLDKDCFSGRPEDPGQVPLVSVQPALVCGELKHHKDL